MILEELERDKEKQTYNKEENQKARQEEQIRTHDPKKAINIGIIFLIILLMLLISYKIADIGFNSVTSWEVDNIELTEENLQILNDTKINIFSKLKDGKIAPMSTGTYRFSVKNKSDYDMIYNIKFEDDMTNYINMKYRLKMDNIYIRGNSEKYVSLDELNLENIIVPKNSINVYTIEWCWENDDENDTKVGSMKDDQYYYFRLQILSNIYNKQ